MAVKQQEMDEANLPDDYGDVDRPAVATAEADAAPPKPYKPARYTKCFRVTHPLFGAMRCYQDTREQAIDEYVTKRCKNMRDGGKAQVECEELPFVPADTERKKPHGWFAPLTAKERTMMLAKTKKTK